MKELFEKKPRKAIVSGGLNSGHADICTCTQCMKSNLSEEVVRDNLHALQSTMVDRRNPDSPGGKPLMKATKAHAILKTGTKINMMEATGISEFDLPYSKSSFHMASIQELTIKATWKDRKQEQGQSGGDASVFGGLGVLAIPAEVTLMSIPKMNALGVPPEFLTKYGAELIPLNKSFTLDAVEDKSLEDLYLVEYQWDADYIADYVMNQRGGGGLFVETHPFPHVFTPLSAECGGALILGVERKDGAFDFASFEIPFGYTMKVGSNVIHGDSFFVGPHAIALTETELADSVLLKKDTPTREIQKVTQTPTKTFSVDFFAENRLSTAVNQQMMVEKIRHEGAAGKDLSFFRQLPKKTLSAVRDLSSDAQQAYDERYGLVPYSPK